MKHLATALLLAMTQVAVADIPVLTGHPRLLISADQVPALRVKCGIGRYRDDPVAQARKIPFGIYREDLDRLRGAVARIMQGHASSDDLPAVAMLHLVTGELGIPDPYVEYVTSELLDPQRRRYELGELLALDWCWESIDLDKRDRMCDRAAEVLDRLTNEQSPLLHLSFSRKLHGLAAAIILNDPEWISDNFESEPALKALLAAAETYIRGPLVQVCRQRGAMPTSGENGIWEEADICLAFELWRSLTGQNLLKEVPDSFGRSLEHYFYADTDFDGIRHGFVHDDGSLIPPAPAMLMRGFVPAVPWVLAQAAGDPVAAAYTDRAFPEAEEPDAEVDRYVWVRILYGPVRGPRVDRQACPLGRNFGGGWVTMRSGWFGGDTVVLFDAGQPFWRARQHFDAGQFQIYRRGRLAIDSGDDVTFEAVAAKGGRTTMAGQRADWDDYIQSTIAHNCVTLSDASYNAQIYGRPWPAMGNQRLIERDYTPRDGDIEKTPRKTGTLTAFETNPFYTYAAADLTAAYPEQTTRGMERQILLAGDVVFVIDRVSSASPRATKTWHLQLPARPSVARPEVATEGPADTAHGVVFNTSRLSPVAATQIHGVDDTAGIWELGPGEDWLTVTQDQGKLFVRTLLPLRAQRRVCGGPMRPREIPEGRMAGLTYFGGNIIGYEHRIWPASMLRAPNAAYELGRPTGLGPHFGVGATWGRYDVIHAEPTDRATFLHVLVPADADTPAPPPLRFSMEGETATVHVELLDQHVDLEIPLGGETPPRITIRRVPTLHIVQQQELTRTVVPTQPLPVQSE